MTPADRGSLRIALLHDDSSGADHASELADGLDRAGHDAQLVRASAVGALESLLRRRGFADSLTRVPAGLTALLRGGFDVAHAFSPTDAAAALTWRRLAARPAVAGMMVDRSRDSGADPDLACPSWCGDHERRLGRNQMLKRVVRRSWARDG